jgi:hypothetical protein
MAQLDRPFDLENLQDLTSLTRQTSDDLPDYIKDTVQWLDLPDYPLGYYIYNHSEQQYTPVEYLENYWYHIYQYSGIAYTSLGECIEPHTQGTGYWRITDPQHPDHDEYWSISGSQNPNYATQLAASSSTAAPTLTVSTQVPSLLSDPTLSPFTAARPPTDAASSDSTSTPREENNSDEPSSEQAQADDPVLVAQLQHGLDIQDREPENPLTPEEPAYLQPVEQAIEAGLNVPPPPPLAHPVHPLAPQLPAPQPIVPIQQNIMAAAANIETGHLRNDPSDLFCGDCSKLDQFKKEFKLWRGLNVNHEIMRSLYLCTMLILSLIKGPLIDDWTNDQIDQLEDKVTRAVASIGQGNEVLWDEFVAELDSHFADTTRKQKAYAALQDLRMRGNNFDSYTATFKYLAKQAGFALTTNATIHLFTLGLNPKLRTAIIARDREPATMDN